MNVVVATEALSSGRSTQSSAADTALRAAAQLWFVVAVGGQWIFASYVALVYGRGAIQGDTGALNDAMTNAYVPGDVLGNLAVAVHLALALVILIGGPLQIVPNVRTRYPVFHRWNGRTYMAAVIAASTAGLVMLWGERATFGPILKAGASLNALLIFTFAGLALRAALARDFRTHRRWALRLFVTATAVWFFRVSLMSWVLINGPVGINFETGEGPFLDVMAFGQYLIPLAVLEIHLRTQDRAGPAGRWTMAAALVVLTFAMGLGIFAATMGMWLPKML